MLFTSSSNIRPFGTAELNIVNGFERTNIKVISEALRYKKNQIIGKLYGKVHRRSCFCDTIISPEYTIDSTALSSV